MQKVPRRWILRAYRLSAGSSAASIQPCGKHAGVIEDQQVVGPQHFREFAELAVGETSRIPRDMHHAGGVPVGQRFLGDEFVGKLEVEIGNQHRSDYRS